jgi:hypothetical protein
MGTFTCQVCNREGTSGSVPTCCYIKKNKSLLLELINKTILEAEYSTEFYNKFVTLRMNTGDTFKFVFSNNDLFIVKKNVFVSIVQSRFYFYHFLIISFIVSLYINYFLFSTRNAT